MATKHEGSGLLSKVVKFVKNPTTSWADLDQLNHVNNVVYVRWLQEVCRFQPSTVSRRLSIVVGFYRVCVIDGLLPHSPAEARRRAAMSFIRRLGDPVLKSRATPVGICRRQFFEERTLRDASDHRGN